MFFCHTLDTLIPKSHKAFIWRYVTESRQAYILTDAGLRLIFSVHVPPLLIGISGMFEIDADSEYTVGKERRMVVLWFSSSPLGCYGKVIFDEQCHCLFFPLVGGILYLYHIDCSQEMQGTNGREMGERHASQVSG